jgi:hypothetical protein
MTFAHQSKSYDVYEIVSFMMGCIVFSVQMAVLFIVRGTLAISVVIVIRVFTEVRIIRGIWLTRIIRGIRVTKTIRGIRVTRIIRVFRLTRINSVIRVIRTIKVLRVVRVSRVILLFLGVVGLFYGF